MKVRILRPVDCVEFEADAVFLPGMQCPFEVLPGHGAIISTLEEGEIRWRYAGKEESVAVRSGVVRLKDGVMNICTE